MTITAHDPLQQQESRPQFTDSGNVKQNYSPGLTSLGKADILFL